MSAKDHVDAIIAAASSSFGALMAFCAVLLGLKNKGKIDAISVHVDGKMEELLKSIGRTSHLEGRQDERDIQQDRKDVKDAEARQDVKDERDRQ